MKRTEKELELEMERLAKEKVAQKKRIQHLYRELSMHSDLPISFPLMADNDVVIGNGVRERCKKSLILPFLIPFFLYFFSSIFVFSFQLCVLYSLALIFIFIFLSTSFNVLSYSIFLFSPFIFLDSST